MVLTDPAAGVYACVVSHNRSEASRITRGNLGTAMERLKQPKWKVVGKVQHAQFEHDAVGGTLTDVRRLLLLN